MIRRLKPVRGPLDVEAMRLVRNSCRQFMTRDIVEITAVAQAAWWANLTAGDPDFETWKPFLLIDGATTLGYGIAWHGERVNARERFPESLTGWWLTGGLLPQARGHGYGRFLFERLIEIAGTPCWLDVRADNAPARTLYARLGFEIVGVDPTNTFGTVLTMKKRSKSKP